MYTHMVFTSLSLSLSLSLPPSLSPPPSFPPPCSYENSPPPPPSENPLLPPPFVVRSILLYGRCLSMPVYRGDVKVS